MARMSISNAMSALKAQEESRSNFSGKYVNKFIMKGDGAQTFVKFLIEDLNDVEVYSVHQVRMKSKNGKDYAVSVDCLGSNCPLCREAPNHINEKYPMIPMVTKAKHNVTIPLINAFSGEDGKTPAYEVLMWSTWMYKKIQPMLARIRPITQPIELLRTGTSTDTSYSAFGADPDADEVKALSGTVEELKTKFDVKDDDIYGRNDSLIKAWTAEQMEEYISTGTYPSNSGSQADGANEPVEEAQPVTRRTATKHGF